MRLVFLGSGEFAVPALEHLARQGLAPRRVVTQPDRPAGRGRVPSPPPVKEAALRLGLPVIQPASIGAPEALEALRVEGPEFLVVADYGQILPPEVLAIPRRAAVNLHGSLLPRWRGAAPVARAILAGDRVTGVTTIRMDAGVDTGEILLQREVAIEPRDTAADLEARLARAGGPLLEATLRRLEDGTLDGRQQPREGATRAPRLGVEEARLDWSLEAGELDRRVRAFNPWPGAWSLLERKRVKIWRARPIEEGGAGHAPAGAVVRAAEDAVRVACGRGFLDLDEVQFPGGRRLSARDAVHGRKIRAGQIFDA